MKFSETKKGTRAERPIDLPRGDGEAFKMLVRPLNAQEEKQVLETARALAIKQGVADPKEGDALYDFELMIQTILLGCLDPDSPADAREQSFDLGAVQVNKELNREEIAFLYERQQLWQDECSPSISKMSADDLLLHAMKIAEAEDDLPFVQLRPNLRLILLRTLANLLLTSHEVRLQSGSPTDKTTTDAKPPPSSTP